MMLRILLITSLFIGHSLCCIPCDPRGKAARDKFQTFINSQNYEDVEVFIRVKWFAKTAERQVLKYLEEEVGTLDKYAISEIVSEYKKSVDVIEDLDFREVQLLHIVTLHFQRLQDKLKAIVHEADKRRCPNKQGADSCGLMVQTFTDCNSCEEEKIICAGGPPKNQEYFDRCSCLCIQNRCFDLKTGYTCSPCNDHKFHITEAIRCVERNIKIPEDEDLILDCNFEWHARLEDSYKNNFIKRGVDQVRVTEDPYLEIKEIQMEDSGTYVCNTMLDSGVPVNNIIYHVTVIGGLGRTTEKYKTRPTLPDVLDIEAPESPAPPEDLGISGKGLIAAFVAGPITILFIAGICMFIYCRKKHPEAAEKEPV